jgi:hypothetical protein
MNAALTYWWLEAGKMRKIVDDIFKSRSLKLRRPMYRGNMVCVSQGETGDLGKSGDVMSSWSMVMARVRGLTA